MNDKLRLFIWRNNLIIKENIIQDMLNFKDTRKKPLQFRNFLTNQIGGGKKLKVTYVQFGADTYIVWIGPFANLKSSEQYLTKVKPRLPKEIISFIPVNQYEIYLLGKSNIVLIKNEEDLLLYKEFMFKNIYKP